MAAVAMRNVLLVILAVLIVAAGLIYTLFARDMAEARARLVGRSQTIDTAFGKLEYAEMGKGDPVLVIHGTGGGFDQGLDMTGALAEGGYRLIAPSRFGYLGSSYPEDATVAMQADAFVPLLDKLGMDKLFVFGGSAGALSAMQFAIRHPDRVKALVLVVPAAHAPTRKPNTSGAEGPLMETMVRAMLGSDFIFWAGVKFFPDAMTRMLLATDPALVHAADHKEQERVGDILRNILPVSVRAEGLMFDMKTAGNPEPVALDAIRCPVLTVSMKDDTFGTYDPAEYIAANVANGRAVLYPTGGHVWVGHEDDIWREIEAFLESVGTNAESAVAP